jgi:hypothetical protein
MGEQAAGENSAARTGRHHLLGGQKGVQLAKRTLIPAAGVLDVDDLAHGCRRCRRHPAMLDRCRCRAGWRFQQIAQRRGRRLGSRQRQLQAAEVANTFS